MSDTRRDLLLRFAAGAIAAACGGRKSFAEDRQRTPPPRSDPEMMAVYGPPPNVPPVVNCGAEQNDRCGSDGKPGPDGKTGTEKPDDGGRHVKPPPKGGG